jgi:hypothetical protein
VDNPYTWSQLPNFTLSRQAIEGEVSEWDLFQWAIEDTLCPNPEANSHPVGGGSDLLYFKTWEHPGTSHLPRLVVVFRIAERPAGGKPGLLEGHRIVRLGDLDGGDIAGSTVLPWA